MSRPGYRIGKTGSAISINQTKRKRTIVSSEQLQKLHAFFKDDPWPSKMKKEQFANELDMNVGFISVWFQNYRAKLKKEGRLRTNLGTQSSCSQSSLESRSHNEWIEATQGSSLSLGAIEEIGKQDSTVDNIGLKPSDSGSELGYLDLLQDDDPKMARSEDEPEENSTQSRPRIKQTTPATARHPATTSSESRQSTAAPRVPETALSQNTSRPRPPQTLFHDIVNMMAIVEGGIIGKDDQDFDQAANHAMYGILINGDSRLVYSKENGLDLIPWE